jgi:hypothetical protein
LKEPGGWTARHKLRITFCARQLRSEPSSRIRGAIARYWSAAGIATKVEPITSPMRLKPRICLGTVKAIAETGKLILNESI